MSEGKIVILMIYFGKYISAANMSGHVDGGQYSKIWQFPHSVFLTIDCGFRQATCGASIVNQAILLTAAHCLDRCSYPRVYSYVGNEHQTRGTMTRVSNMFLHENYNKKTLKNDIAVLRLKKDLVLNKNIARVVLMKNPPYDEHAFIAGWGRVKPGGKRSIYLKHISQRVYKPEQCWEIGLMYVPKGTICGEHWQKLGNPEKGDSGSALVVRNRYIQIGIVSYARLHISKTNTVYTDTGYFYNWIKKHTERLYCEE